MQLSQTYQANACFESVGSRLIPSLKFPLILSILGIYYTSGQKYAV